MLEIARAGNFICGAGVLLLALSLAMAGIVSRKASVPGTQFNQVKNNQVETYYSFVDGEQQEASEASAPYWPKPSQEYPRGISAALIREQDIESYEAELARMANHV